ncbi:hypothetical protein [Commensalibacter papalotli (ex Botero et al. 2024)]|uniref:Uncharacterized protein n=1 Tax=Commensalibacter papalotli (ex Botero et al. 2024) TaxID=2972766 RepID=A0ABN8W4Y4_9PROT|nr:hypothetical protein [Commensalibacter papalotli (ex Botero et al. 2024)]CAI3925680.1 unnamed protein product [Commensalibacter papalotli (ex Botero et al. 2024)]CAI3926374.1 unnamed protein product [Commensalibacter papalotli (ex Botero et al. 2024)]
MIKKIFLITAGLLFPLITNAGEPVYQLDGKDGNWSAFHYYDPQLQKVTACFALSNDLTLGFKSNDEGVGLLLWDKQGNLVPKTDSKAAITVGKQHFIFMMQAMDKNISMNRLTETDFKGLLQALSYGQIALLEYQKHPVSMVDLSGLPNMLVKFHQCIEKAKFKDYK